MELQRGHDSNIKTLNSDVKTLKSDVEILVEERNGHTRPRKIVSLLLIFTLQCI